ncbi:MAG: nucleoside kinase [Ruminococcaceae bacterium]|nr:nucleoside kinase [Oscillospiraceae bacterium]
MSEIDLSYINRRGADEPDAFVLGCEKKYKNFIADIASRVAKNDKIRIILLAGPSGSGKTTTANMLRDKLIDTGLESAVISLDDFYRDSTDPEYPRLENGERDFESVDALNLSDIEKTLVSIADGKDFTVPHYDFKVGGRVEVRKYSKISHGCVIIEGLHAMNPRIYEHLPTDKMLRIFISVSTNINDGGERILSGRKLRFTRRMVRDSIYRGADAERTLEMWENVLVGEDKYLYPYRKYADIDFNTFHEYEPCVMRSYAEKLISPELAKKNSYAKTVLAALTKVEPLNEELVPEDSLLREFITGGIYEEFY